MKVITKLASLVVSSLALVNYVHATSCAPYQNGDSIKWNYITTINPKDFTNQPFDSYHNVWKTNLRFFVQYGKYANDYLMKQGIAVVKGDDDIAAQLKFDWVYQDNSVQSFWLETSDKNCVLQGKDVPEKIASVSQVKQINVYLRK